MVLGLYFIENYIARLAHKLHHSVASRIKTGLCGIVIRVPIVGMGQSKHYIIEEVFEHERVPKLFDAGVNFL